KREVGSSNLPRPTRLMVDAGWSSPVARWAHNPKVAGSNPAPATNFVWCLSGGVAQLAEHMVCNHGVRGSNPLTSTRYCDQSRLERFIGPVSHIGPIEL